MMLLAKMAKQRRQKFPSIRDSYIGPVCHRRQPGIEAIKVGNQFNAMNSLLPGC